MVRVLIVFCFLFANADVRAQAPDPDGEAMKRLMFGVMGQLMQKATRDMNAEQPRPSRAPNRHPDNMSEEEMYESLPEKPTPPLYDNSGSQIGNRRR